MAIDISKTVQTWGAIAGALVAIAGVIVGVEGHYAKAEALQRLELRVEQKILGDRADKLQERIWKLEDRYMSKPQAPKEVQETWRILEQEQKAIEIQIQKTLENSQKVK